MKKSTKRFLAMILAFVIVIGLLPGSFVVDADEIPFTASVNGTPITAITQDTMEWWDFWSNDYIEIPKYQITIPRGTEKVTLVFDEEKQCSYYDSKGTFLGYIDDDSSMPTQTEHTAAIKMGDGELWGVSVQDPSTYATDSYIQFVYEESGEEVLPCLTVSEQAPKTASVSAGGQYKLNLKSVFKESEGHDVEYTFKSDINNEHIKMDENATFYFTTKDQGDYDVTFTAKCEEREVSHTITITVGPANPGIPAQYGYEETDKSSVTVYVTLSNDGYPLLANDGSTVMSHLKVTVPYFDLALYGLEEFYRYGTENGSGPYVNDKVIKRPTGLHLYIYLLERYYMGLPEERCCLGTSGVLDYDHPTDIYYMDEEFAYESNGKKAFYRSGGPTSIYMVNFWGHDENLMYFRNHCYPYMAPGWGSTSDYILLSDGDVWDVGMFSNWAFNNYGYFASFDKNTYTVDPEQELTVATVGWGTTENATDFEAKTGLTVGLYDSEWILVEELDYSSENKITFTAPKEDGIYYLMALDSSYKNKDDACIAPATARVLVGNPEETEQTEISRILLDKYEEAVWLGRELQLTASVIPAEATGWTVNWTSSNTDVATVDQNGLVTTIGEGEAEITASIGEISASCKVTVSRYNTAPVVAVKAEDSYSKIKTGTEAELNLSAMFTDEQNDALTYEVTVCQPTSVSSSFEYVYEPIEDVETEITEEGICKVKFDKNGIYALRIKASDGKLSTTHTYQFTVADNDAGTIQLNDGVVIDFYNVVVVDSNTEFKKDFSINDGKGTHDTYVHNIVLSKNTISGTPSRKMNFKIQDGYGWSQYAATGLGTTSAWSTRADIRCFAYDATGETTEQTAHYLKFYTECVSHADEDHDAVCERCTMNFGCETCTDADTDKYCDVCAKWLNNRPILKEGVENLTVKILTNYSYQLERDLLAGEIFEDPDNDSLTTTSYFYRKSSDNGETWSELTGFRDMEFGGTSASLSNSEAGTYLYEFVAYDGYEYSEETWLLTLQVMDSIPAEIKFYVGQDQNYKAGTQEQYPVLELYKTAGIDEQLFDYVGWFINAKGEKEYVYNPADYTILDGETDYVVIGGVQYELHDYEKIVFTDSSFGTDDESAVASGTVVDKYNMFYALIDSGRYSTRAYGYSSESEKYDLYLGGQSMILPMEDDIYGGGGSDIYLRVISVYTTSKKSDGTYFNADDYYVEMIMPVTGSMVHSGQPYSKGNYAYYPFLTYAAGNASLYNFYVYPKDTDNYMFSQTINQTTAKGNTAVTKTGTISTALKLKVHVPKDSDFGLYLQYNNFNTKEVEPVGDAVINEDGTKTITYKVSKGNSNYTWRLADPTGTYVTKAGWLSSISQDTEKTFTFSTFINKKTHDYSNLGSAVGSRDEGDIQVFLDPDGFMGTTDAYRIRAYRMWEIIDSDPGNIMIEPDFNIQVLQGNESDIRSVNAGNAMNNWIDVTPTTTDIVAVNYDAIDVYNTSNAYGSHGGLFPASNPERTGVFVITNDPEGKAKAHVPFNGGFDTSRGAEWDYNYDTWYYEKFDSEPTLDFKVEGTEGLEVSYATVITNQNLESTLSGWKTISADENGYYHGDMLDFRKEGALGGTVIIKMTDETGTSYQLVRVAEMTASITNVTNPGEPFQPGNEVEITFDGLYRTVNKVAGIFNPMTYYLTYKVNGQKEQGALGQYQQMDRSSLTFTIPNDLEFPSGENKTDYLLTDGHIFGSMMSASSPFSTLYNMTDTGVGTNFSAVGVQFVLSRMADIKISVEKPVLYDMKVEMVDGESEIKDYSFTLYDAEGNELTPNENGIYEGIVYGTYTYVFGKAGYVGQNTTMRVGSLDASNVVDGILHKKIPVVKAAENGWDGSSVKEPELKDGVYQIGTGAELAWFAQTVNAGNTSISAVLTRDIDLANYQWTPIGNNTNKFAGTFDGQNYKVYHMQMIYTATSTTSPNLGFFGCVQGAKICNLNLEGTITANNPDQYNVSTANIGGVIGNIGGSTVIDHVHSEVDITINREAKGNWARIGGIAGGISNDVTITNSSNTGNISGYQYVGGIAGYSSNSTVIRNCFNAGDISGYTYVAGIVSTCVGAQIYTSYNSGNITATNSSSGYIGGITAQCSGATTVMKNCFNIGAVSTVKNGGAIIGSMNSNAATAQLANLYYLEGTYSVGIGVNRTEVNPTEISEQTLALAEFVAAMNEGLETAAFKKGDGHPVLTWQTSEAEEPDEPEVKKGDANGDGNIDTQDVILVLRYINTPDSVEQIVKASADMNQDGNTDTTDVIAILQYVNNGSTN